MVYKQITIKINMLKNYNFCNNCGKEGHLYQNCKMPITSLGIISIKETDELEDSEFTDDSDELFNFDKKQKTTRNNKYMYLMICRKDSLGYVDFMRGKYPLHNKEYLVNIFNEMTVKEKENLMTQDFSTLWKNLWGNYLGVQYRGEEKTSKEKYNSLKNGITIKNEFLTLEYFIKNSTTKWIEPEWGFPKGRRNYQEKDIDCAIREFEEETGFKRDAIKIVNNIHPVQEIFTGSNYKSYKHKYFLAIMNKNNKDTDNFQKTEVSKMEWLCYKDCIKKIRPYNLEKIELIGKINKMLNKYTVIS